MSEELEDWTDDAWTYDPERDDPWLDEAVASMDRGEWVTHEEVVREIDEILAEAVAEEAAREKAAR